MGCSQPDVAESYANVSITEGKVSSTVNGVQLQKKVEAQVIDEVGSNTLMGCGFELIKEDYSGFKQGVQTPALHVPSSRLFIASLHQKQQRMEANLAELKELSVKRHEDLLSLLAALPLLLPENTPGLPVSILFSAVPESCSL